MQVEWGLVDAAKPSAVEGRVPESHRRGRTPTLSQHDFKNSRPRNRALQWIPASCPTCAVELLDVRPPRPFIAVLAAGGTRVRPTRLPATPTPPCRLGDWAARQAGPPRRAAGFRSRCSPKAGELVLFLIQMVILKHLRRGVSPPVEQPHHVSEGFDCTCVRFPGRWV